MSCLLTESQSETEPAPRWRLVQNRIHAPLVWHHLSMQSSPAETPACTGTRCSPLLSVQVRISGLQCKSRQKKTTTRNARFSTDPLWHSQIISISVASPLLSKKKKKQRAQAVGSARSLCRSVGKAATHITVNGRRRVALNASPRHHTMKS